MAFLIAGISYVLVQTLDELFFFLVSAVTVSMSAVVGVSVAPVQHLHHQQVRNQPENRGVQHEILVYFEVLILYSVDCLHHQPQSQSPNQHYTHQRPDYFCAVVAVRMGFSRRSFRYFNAGD